MTSVKLSVTLDPCCDRMKYLTDILHQARNLNLSETYIVSVENVLLDMLYHIPNQNQTEIITIYDTNIDNIIAQRDNAFNTWRDEIKNKYTAVPKTEIPIIE